MFVSLDIGGTKTRIAFSEDGESFAPPVKIDTPHNFDEGIAAIAALIKSAEGPIEAAALGIAGVLSKDKHTLLNSPNLPEWVGKPLYNTLSEALNTKLLFIENDAAIVGLGESHKGAGQGADIVAYLTVSTGVGGVRIVKGKIDQNAFGFEPGHQVLDMDGTVAPFLGIEAEDLVSGAATEIRFGKKAYQVNDPTVWEELARMVAYMVNNTVVHWSPDVVVLGGSMMVGNPAIPVGRVEAHLHSILSIFPEKPKVDTETLADIGGIHGGFVFINQQLGTL